MKTANLKTTCIAILLSATLMFTGCLNNKKRTEIDPAFGEYISGYTFGVITKQKHIQVELSNDYKLADGSFVRWDTPVTEKLFEFEPEIKGVTRWVNSRMLEFIPDAPLSQGTVYNCDFKLNKLLHVPETLETFPFQFATMKQNFDVTLLGLNAINKINYEYQQLTGFVETRDVADSNEVRKLLSAIQDGKDLKIRWTYELDNKFEFKIDSILRTGKPGKVTVAWDGSPMGIENKGSKEEVIAPLGDFKLMDTKMGEGENQSVILQFSDPLLVKQNLDGIITLSGVEGITYSIEGNNVTVFIPNQITGTKTINISTGLKNIKGYKLLQEQHTDIYFPEPGPKVRLTGTGNILPNSNGLYFAFEAIALKAVDVKILKVYQNNIPQFLQVNNMDGNHEFARVAKKLIERKVELNTDKKTNLLQWNRFSFDMGKFIAPEPGAIYRVEIRFNKKYAVCNCPAGTADEGENDNKEKDDDGWNENHWNETSSYEGIYDEEYWNNEHYTPCNREYYYGKVIGKNVLASDLGLISKMGEDKIAHVFVNNLINTQPIGSCTVEFYDYQHQLIASGITDAIGMAAIKLKSKPFLLVAKYGQQRGYLKLEDGTANAISKFDVGGETVQKGVKGFIYGERGVWRPGDSLFLSFMMEDKNHVLPAGHPVTFELINPQEQVVQKIVKTKSVNNLFDFRTKADDNAVTGNWQAKVTVGNRVFTERVKIETVKPNRLKIYIDFGKPMITHADKDSNAVLRVKWLHGAVAKNLDAKIDVTINKTGTHFEKYKGYTFDSPLRDFTSDQQTIFEGKVDDKGEAVFHTNLQGGDAAPGMLRAYFNTKVFEEGGDFSIDRYSVLYSPYNSYVGIHVPQGTLYGNTFETDKPQVIDVATVNSDGKPLSKKKLDLKIYKIQWRWWWDSYDDNLANYLSRSGTVPVLDSAITTTNGKGSFKFQVNRPEYGRYLITLTDPESGHATGKVVYVDWPYWARANRTETENATMLNFACDKEKYTTAESIKLTIPTPSDGKALVCVENGTKVLKKFWIDTKKGETHCEIPTTPDMAPNAYVHVSLLQPHQKTTNDLPIRLYGILPVLVEDPQTHVLPVITMLDVLKPETTASIKVKEEKGKAMTYTLAMVDEGLLDLTRFKTPEPWKTFYAREALGVKTWDIYDMVMGAYAGKLNKMLTIGGDGDNGNKKATKANRFKPMVRFYGPFSLKAGMQNTHTIPMPNYVGSVRVMVIAGQNGAYGEAEKTVAVRKPLMVLATLPRVVGPAETVYLPVDIFAMEKHVKDVKISVECNEFFTIEGNKTEALHFNEAGDEVVNFKLKVAEKTGVGKVKVIATSGNEKAVHEIEIAVRTPNPQVTDMVETIVEPGKSWTADYAFNGIEGTNKGTVEISSVPPIDLQKRLDYLIQYPHGCIEQTTSSVFPQLFVGNITELKANRISQIADNIKAGLHRLQLFQTSSGAFSYWPGQTDDCEWGSNYAGHFMLEAEKKGYTIPGGMKARWIKYQQRAAREWSATAGNSLYNHPHGSESYQLIQSYRLYTLALASAPELGAMNRLREENNLSNEARWRLAAAYQLAGQTEVAKQLIEKATIIVKPYVELSYSYGSDMRDRAMILETLSILNEKGKAGKLAIELSKEMSSNRWMSTQETAYGLLAFSKYFSVVGTSNIMQFSYSINNGTAVSKSTTIPVCQVVMNDKELVKSGKFSIDNKGTGVLYVRVIQQGIPVTGDQTSSASNLTLSVKYTTLKGIEINPEKLQQGTDFVAEVSISNPGTRGYLSEMALNQIFPSGWEIHNSRMDENVSAQGGDQPTYQDIRDDRVYSYYNIASGTAKYFKVLLNATYLGKFYLPTVESEAMYDNTINSRVPGKWVEVVKEVKNVAVK